MNNKASLKLSHPAVSPWRHWLLVGTLLAFLSVFTTALTHHHEDQKANLDCPICHVVGHQSLDGLPSALVIGPGLLLYFVFALPLLSTERRSIAFHPRPFSQAPPLRYR